MPSFVHSTSEPMRLDRAVSQALGLGLRQVRALIQGGQVSVDGHLLRKGVLVRPGQCVSIMDQSVTIQSGQTAQVERVMVSERFAALHKPANLHSVAGKNADSVEVCLPDMGLAGWQLLNRLDFLTSGLVLAAATPADAAEYKSWQDQGLVRKCYLALAHGAVERLKLQGRILDDARRKVRVLDEEDVPLRGTEVLPVRNLEHATLVLAIIAKGRRHQIRAHLARAGHPLVGDPLYGQGAQEGLMLHHWHTEMPGFTATCLPAWPNIPVTDVSLLALLEQVALHTNLS